VREEREASRGAGPRHRHTNSQTKAILHSGTRGFICQPQDTGPRQRHMTSQAFSQSPLAVP
jgi:hypothetical protein